MSDSRTSFPSLTYLPNLSAGRSRSVLERAAEWLADTPIPPSLFVAGNTTSVLVCSRAPVKLSVIVMVLAVTYASYAIDRIVDRTSEPGVKKSNLNLALSALVLLAISSALAFVNRGPLAAACALFFPLSVAAYCLPWLSVVPSLRARGIRRVKDIPYTKNVYTAGCIAMAGVWAAHVSGIVGVSQLAAVAILMFVVDFINTAACDLGDVEADARNGVPTFAVLFGRVKMARALRIVAYVYYASMAVCALSGLLSPIALLLALAVLPTDAYLRVLSRDATPGIVADLAPDLTEAAIGLLALILSACVGG